MILTPVRVRGKKGNKRSTGQIKSDTIPRSEVSENSHTDIKAPVRFLEAITQDANPAPKQSKELSPQELPRFSSHIGRLPPELLQMIFLLSMNMDFPLAAPWLASVLSSKFIYRSICRKAFVRKREPLHALLSPQSADAAPEHEDSKAEYWDAGDAALHTSILKRRWMNTDFWEDFKKDVAKRGKGQTYFCPGTELPRRILVFPLTPENRYVLLEWAGLGAGIDCISTTSGEVVTKILTQALVDGDSALVKTLISSPIGSELNVESMRSAFRTAGYQMHSMETILKINALIFGDPMWASKSAQFAQDFT